MNADSIYSLIYFENNTYSYKNTLISVAKDPIALLTLIIHGHDRPNCFKIESKIHNRETWIRRLNISYSKSNSVSVYINRNYVYHQGLYRKIFFRYKENYYTLSISPELRIIELYAKLHQTLR